MINQISKTESMRRKTLLQIKLFSLPAISSWLTPIISGILLVQLQMDLAWGGQSIHLVSQMVQNSSIPAQPVSQSCTIEMQVSRIGGTFSASTPCGLHWGINQISADDFRIGMFWARGTPDTSCLSPRLDTILPSQVFYARFSIDTQTKVTSCELWDENLKRVWNSQQQHFNSSGANWDGVVVPSGWGSDPIDYGFFRIVKGLISYGGSAPSTAYNSNMLVHWKFDQGNNIGSLQDASGNGYHATLSAGSATYVPQVGQNIVRAVPKTCDAPVWSPWRTQRTGVAGQTLCGGESNTQADTTVLNFQWKQTKGPTTLTLGSPNFATTTANGYAFGGYSVELKVTDAAMNTDTQTLDYGAATCDSNGILTPRTPNVTKIFGPMICFGYSPWGYMDERALTMVKGQQIFYHDQGFDDPSWTHFGAGTVSYMFGGNGFPAGRPGGTLAQNISGTETSIVIDDAGNLPCLADTVASGKACMLFLESENNRELIRVCGASAAAGNNVTLNVCYDGRGLTYVNNDTGIRSVKTSHNSGIKIASSAIVGSGSKFITDSSVPLCPAGVGPAGPIVYQSGKVAVVANGTTITGTGTTWNADNGVAPWKIIRVAATHGGGIPFVYWAAISAVTDTTHLEVTRALPSDVDSGPFNYQIIGPRLAAFGFTTSDGGSHLGYQALQGCESDTLAYAMPVRDITGVNWTAMTGQSYTYISGPGIGGAFGPNFYGSGLALRSFYERSGYTLALETARKMDNVWVKHPELAGGLYGGFVLNQGGGAIGAIASKVLDPESKLDWLSDLTPFAARGAYVSGYSCESTDARDSGYMAAWVALHQIFDPDPTRHATWTTALKAILQRDKTCGAATNYSYASAYWSGSASPVSFTNGSATGTGTGLPSSLCLGTGVQTVTVTNGSAVATATSGTFPSDTGIVSIKGIQVEAHFIDSTHLQMAVPWSGTNGSFTSMTRGWGNGANELGTWGSHLADPNLKKNYICVYNDTTSITLDRPWEGANGTYYNYNGILAGYGVQPFMLGIKLAAMKWATYSDDPSIVSGYNELLPLTGKWFKENGYDPSSKGLYYGAGFGAVTTQAQKAAPLEGFYWVIPGARFGSVLSSIKASRALISESSAALTAYLGTGNSDRVTWGDETYASVWGYCPWTAPGYPCDPHFVSDENNDVALQGYKWPGFFFGMGMAHQWPASRPNSPPTKTPRPPMNLRSSTRQ